MSTQRQEWFDYVVQNLKIQGKKSGKIKPGQEFFTCLYRGPEGRRCAFGWLISNEEYTPDIENRSADAVIDDLNLVRFFDEKDFILELQEAHDEGAAEEIEWNAFRQLASRWELDGSELP